MRHSTDSIWLEDKGGSKFPSLQKDQFVDVAVIGGGITGLTAAYLLTQAGKSVAILEMNRLFSGETGHTTAHLSQILDTPYHQIIADFGMDGARQVVESTSSALSFIESLLSHNETDAGFSRVPGYLFSESQVDVEGLRKELKALSTLGIRATWCDNIPLPFSTIAGIRCPKQARFSPLPYLDMLTKEVTNKGGLIFENTMVTDMSDEDLPEVRTSTGTVTANFVIDATNSPITSEILIHTKQAAYRSYALAFETYDNFMVPGLFWDSEKPYHYIRSHRLRSGRNLVIVGGEDHRTGARSDTEACFKNLEEYAASRFQLKYIHNRWSGQIIEPIDGLPFIGRSSQSERFFVATGFSGSGMVFGTVAGMIMADLALGRPDRWGDIYNASRFKPIAGASNFIIENLDTTWHYLKDWIKPAEALNLSSLIPGEGKIMTLAGKKAAVYRNDRGHLQALSPVCPHLGGQVHFNESEKSWDCPCHGSRFGLDGKVINGPALSPLEKVSFPLTTEDTSTEIRLTSRFPSPRLEIPSTPTAGETGAASI